MSDETRAWKDQYMLRFPDGMRDRLKAEAAQNNRSLNAEIISRLEQSFPSETSETSDARQELEKVTTLIKRIDEMLAKKD